MTKPYLIMSHCCSLCFSKINLVLHEWYDTIWDDMIKWRVTQMQKDYSIEKEQTVKKITKQNNKSSTPLGVFIGGGDSNPSAPWSTGASAGSGRGERGILIRAVSPYWVSSAKFRDGRTKDAAFSDPELFHAL